MKVLNSIALLFFISVMSVNFSGCAFLLFGAGAATGVAVAEHDDDDPNLVEKKS